MNERALTLGEEIANAVTHGLGLLLSLAAVLVLLTSDLARTSARGFVGAAVFGVTLVLLYTASTLYHALPQRRAKRVFRVLDHSAIYLLIAGTYTPFALGPLHGPVGWTLLGVVWLLAVAGIVLKSVGSRRFERASTWMYLLMGWLAVAASRSLLAHVPTAGILWLLAGGLLYTVGVVFFAWDRLRYFHPVWHLFVLAGSICHFFAVLWYAVPSVARAA